MRKQISPIVKLKGKIDDLSFYKSQDGFMARAKGGVSAERLRTDPKFDQTRRAQSEFSIGGKAGKLFRQAWNNELAKASDNRVASRVTKTMVEILKTDSTRTKNHAQPFRATHSAARIPARGKIKKGCHKSSVLIFHAARAEIDIQ